VRRAVEGVAVKALVTVLSGAVVFLTGETADWEALRSAVAAAGGSGCRVGVGGLCGEPGELANSYQQALLALRLQKGGLVPDRTMTYEDLGMFRALLHPETAGAVEDFVRDWLGALIDYDARKGGDLVHTLSVYLERGGSHAAAAEALSVHRSTLRYRLDRIREILGRDLSQADIRFNLQLATRCRVALVAMQDKTEEPLLP